jgi:hypothetical protein
VADQVVPNSGTPASGTATGASRKWDKNADGVPDVLEDADTRKRLLRKYGYTEADLKNKASRDLFYEAVRKEYSRKEANAARDEVYVNDRATVSEIVDKSGFTMELIRAYPELREVFRRLSDMLARGKVTEQTLFAKFEELIADTAFGKRTNTEIAADLDRYKENNESNWLKRVERTVTRISEFFTAEAGGQLDQAAAEELAIELIYAGEETDQMAVARRVRRWITDNRKPADDDAAGEPGSQEFTGGGERGRLRTTLANWFSANGLVVQSETLDGYIDQIQTGGTTIDELKQWYRDNRLSVTYGGYADDFARGMDASEIAMDFRSVMANLLERTIEDVDFDDPLVQRAMQRRGEDGKARPMTRYEFEQEVRSTDDWQKTDNAMSMYTDIGEGILRSFGFRG